jgi:hypothetical protein
VSEEVSKLFFPEGRDPRAHYYHNVTGTFKGDWVFDKEIASKVDQEFPLPPAPKANDGKNETVAGINGALNGTETPTVDKPTALDPEAPTNSTKEESEDEKPADTIEDNKPKYQEDVEKFRGPFRFNESGKFVFNLKETKANEYVNWVKVLHNLVLSVRLCNARLTDTAFE